MEIQEGYSTMTVDKNYLKNRTPQQKAIQLVYGLAKSEEHIEGPFQVTDVKIVWFCKTLQNWKAMVALLVENGGFYEVTYNGDKEETYVDYYKKQSNTVVKDADL